MRRGIMNNLLGFLAVADLGNVIVGCFDWTIILAHRGPWWTTWPNWLCPATRYAGMVFLYASIQTQLAVCVERYVATKRPLHAAHLLTRPVLAGTLATVWATSGLFAAPYAIYSKVYTGNETGLPICVIVPNLPTSYKLFEMLLYYAVPCATIFTLYAVIAHALWAAPTLLRHRSKPNNKGIRAANGCPSANGLGDRKRARARDDSILLNKTAVNDAAAQLAVRRRVVRLLCICVLIYCVCYSPIQLLFLSRLFNFTINIGHNYKAVLVLNALCYANSACNPVVYTVCSERFRSAIWTVLTCGNRLDGKRPPLNSASGCAYASRSQPPPLLHRERANAARMAVRTLNRKPVPQLERKGTERAELLVTESNDNRLLAIREHAHSR